MNVLIVYAHPEPRSFNGAMKDLAVAELEAAGHCVTLSDLYAMKFDAAGGPLDFSALEDETFFQYQREQIAATGKSRFTPALKAEMDKLLWADFVLFQFPLWWFSLPAILKGWVDRVFAMGFSYSLGASYETGIFRGKRAMLAVTTGGAIATYGAGGRNGEIDQVLRHIHQGMLRFVGMDVLPPFIAYRAARVTPEERASYLEAYAERLRTLETTPPLIL